MAKVDGPAGNLRAIRAWVEKVRPIGFCRVSQLNNGSFQRGFIDNADSTEIDHVHRLRQNQDLGATAFPSARCGSPGEFPAVGISLAMLFVSSRMDHGPDPVQAKLCPCQDALDFAAKSRNSWLRACFRLGFSSISFLPSGIRVLPAESAPAARSRRRLPFNSEKLRGSRTFELGA